MSSEEQDRLAEAEEAIDMRDALIAGLAGAASELAEVGQELYRATVLSKAQRVVVGTTLAVMLAATAGLFYVAMELRDIAEASRQNSVVNRQNSELLVDCTVPGGECYERGQNRTGEAVAVIGRASVAAAYCAQRHEEIDQLEKCVLQVMERVGTGS